MTIDVRKNGRMNCDGRTLRTAEHTTTECRDVCIVLLKEAKMKPLSKRPKFGNDFFFFCDLTLCTLLNNKM